MRTTARRDGDGWILNGEKTWITNGSAADVAVVWARAEEGLVGFLVERGTHGYTTSDIHGKWSMRASVTSRLAFADCRVKESDRLKALATNLVSLGIAADESADGLAITGGRPGGGAVRAHGDHLIAMAFALLATCADGPVEVDDAGAVATSFPGFESTFRALGGALELASGAPASGPRNPSR